MYNALSEDTAALTSFLNNGEMSGDLSIQEKGESAKRSKENNESVTTFIEKFFGDFFARGERGSAHQKDASILHHVGSGKTLKIHTYKGKTKNDIIASPTAILDCIFNGCPSDRDGQVAFLSSATVDSFVDNSPYIILINLNKSVGERFSIHHLLDFNLFGNLANGGKFQTDYTLAEKRISPLELFKKYKKLKGESMEKDKNVFGEMEAFLNRTNGVV